MNRTAKRIAIIAATVVTFGLGALAGIALEHHDATAATSSSVSSYNDGYSTGKQDDCQQGFATACAWLGAQTAHGAQQTDYANCIAYVDTHQLASDICEPLNPAACAYYAARHVAAPEFCTTPKS